MDRSAASARELPNESNFLREYRAELERRCRHHMHEADAYDDEGAHIGLARHRRALAAGVHEAILALDEMWLAREKGRPYVAY